MSRYVAVAGQDAGTCDALGWAWTSVRPYILASGSDEGAVLDAAIERAGHDDVVVHDYDAQVAS